MPQGGDTTECNILLTFTLREGRERRSNGQHEWVSAMKRGKIVVLDDNRNVLSALDLLLSQYFAEVTLISRPFELLGTIGEKSPDVVLLDMNFKAGLNTGSEGLYWLSEVKRLHPELPVVMFTAYSDIELAVEALKRGAADFTVKPWDNQRLVQGLMQAMDEGRGNAKSTKGVHQETISLGQSPAMREVISLLDRVAATDANLLITGENGTGKEVFANYVHAHSLRKGKPMVHVDMGAITSSLFESELFGHVKGAFTDAQHDRVGKIEAAEGGTLFLDEIGNLAPEMQAKLLVALQKREVVRVGDNKAIPFNVRLITATNANIFDRVAEGSFREDLFYRINTIHVEIPPLRERQEDIPALVDLFIDEYNERHGKTIKGISPAALDKLRAHPWIGNVRELRHAVEKAVILAESDTLQEGDFSLECVRDVSNRGVPITLEAMERELIQQALERTSYNISLAANELGITRPTLYAKIKKYGL